ncbi:MAG: hypothetical protein JWM53_2666 [bacterium]|nr:hypothetical protein [bacterium]
MHHSLVNLRKGSSVRIGFSFARGDIITIQPDALAYRGFSESGLTDQWTRAAPNDPGPTCCQAPGAVARVLSQTLRRRRRQRTVPSGLWPSDHAGVNVQLARTQ